MTVIVAPPGYVVQRRLSVRRSSTPRSDTESGSGSSTSDEGPSQCRWLSCRLWFSEVEQLGKHIERDHCAPHSDGLFYCCWEGCNRSQKGFNARYKMTVHVRTHTQEKPYSCNKCGKRFSRAENLKIHERSHTGEKPYICEVPGCGKRYSNSSDRFKHSRTHTDNKPYPCKVEGCHKRYTDPSSLRKHVKTYKHFPPSKVSSIVSSQLPPTTPMIVESNNNDRLMPKFDERSRLNIEGAPQSYEGRDMAHIQEPRSLEERARQTQDYEWTYFWRTAMELYALRHFSAYSSWHQPQEQPLDLSKQ